MIEPHQQYQKGPRWTPDRLLERAFQAEREGRYGDALRLAEKVLERAPEQPEALLLRARHWGRSGLPECARAELCDLLARDPESLEARLSLAGLLLLCGEYAPAIDHLHYVARRCATEAGEEGRSSDTAAAPAPVTVPSGRRPQRPMRALWESYTNNNGE